MTKNYFLNSIPVLLLMFCMQIVLSAQPQTFPRNGVYDEREHRYAFVNATIIPRAGDTLQGATMVIEKGRITAIGTRVTIPDGAVVVDCSELFLYPSLIDLYSDYGLPVTEQVRGGRGGGDPRPQYESNVKGAYGWNEALKTDFRAAHHFTRDERRADEYRKLGFGAVLTHRMDGLSRGSATLVLLGDNAENELIIRDLAAHQFSFNKGSSRQLYPSSLMGAIALFRQTWMDAEWYDIDGRNKEYNISLESWLELDHLPHIFEVRDRLEALRAIRMGKENDISFIIKGAGDEYQRLNELKQTGASFIIPLNFPDAYDVEDPFDAEMVDLADLKHWELAPYNAGRLAGAGITFALTSHQLQRREQFTTRVRTAIEKGLSAEDALRALTEVPAAMIGAHNELGTLATGKRANFIITSAPLFDEKAVIHQNWIDGKPHVLKPLPETIDIRGTYDLVWGNQQMVLVIEGEKNKYAVFITPEAELRDSVKQEVKLHFEHNLISMSFKPVDTVQDMVRLSGSRSGQRFTGSGRNTEGALITWHAVKTADHVEKPNGEKKEDEPGDNGNAAEDNGEEENGEEQKNDRPRRDRQPKTDLPPGEVVYPFAPYGWTTPPRAERYLITNATVWTNEDAGVLEHTDVLIDRGKIVQIGENLDGTGAIVIDAEGMHLTAGIIDEHSHIAISRGVNEGTQSSSAEVSIADVINSEDINIYRQLAGGVTAAQLLHGSANAIGGRSAVIKLRWGQEPERMKLEGATPFIKFALGENVKQSNWGDLRTVRFPQSRMGVEQVYEDHFTRAREYEHRRRTDPYTRRDLELEVILEILNDERQISCHSYVQSEINMLMNVAERHGIRINTFTHILEGYKVADKMAAHGAGASSFADWWSFKYEVIDAIPHNPTLLHEQGVVTAVNSDDAEMGRRLNQEAAKSIKHGGMAAEEALKMVTLNPARLLRIDHLTGSIALGKDADLVLWNDHPLSVYSRAQKTWVDGMLLFDVDIDREMRDAIAAERNRLIQLMLNVKRSGGRTQAVQRRPQHHYHCDDVHDELID